MVLGCQTFPRARDKERPTHPMGDQMARERGRRYPQLEALADGEDISFGVFEPGGFCAAGGGDAVGHLHAGHVVLFEFHAAGF